MPTKDQGQTERIDGPIIAAIRNTYAPDRADQLIAGYRTALSRQGAEGRETFGTAWTCSEVRRALGLPDGSKCARYLEAIAALRAAPQREPVGWGHTFRNWSDFEACAAADDAKRYCDKWTDRIPVALVPLAPPADTDGEDDHD